MSDELGAALRALAAQHETPPRVAAAEIRSRATRRSRRRKAALALGTAATAACVLAAVTLTLHTGEATGTRHLPGAASDAPPPGPATPAPRTTSSGVLDLGRHTLTIGDRVMRVDSHSFGRFPAGTRLTVRAKTEMDLLPLEGRPESGTEVKVPYMVELRTPAQQPVYAGGLAFDTKALMALSADSGWVGMSVTDAEWFYRRVRVGDGIDLRSTPVPSADVTTALPGASGE